MAQRSAENAGKAEQSGIAAGQAIRPAIGADQFALDTKCGGLQGNEMNVFEGGAVNGPAKHLAYPSRIPQENPVS